MVCSASSSATARIAALLAVNASTAAVYWSTLAASAAAAGVLGLWLPRAARHRSPVSTHSHMSSRCTPNTCLIRFTV
jgi:hypothetical protein